MYIMKVNIKRFSVLRSPDKTTSPDYKIKSIEDSTHHYHQTCSSPHDWPVETRRNNVHLLQVGVKDMLLV